VPKVAVRLVDRAQVQRGGYEVGGDHEEITQTRGTEGFPLQVRAVLLKSWEITAVVRNNCIPRD
jgi:hypothetical protein